MNFSPRINTTSDDITVVPIDTNERYVLHISNSLNQQEIATLKQLFLEWWNTPDDPILIISGGRVEFHKVEKR